MDGQRFDSWARALAGGLPRRDAIKSLLGFGVAAATTRVVMQEAEACEPQFNYCDPHTPCCSPYVCILHSCDECIKQGHTFCGGHEDCCKGSKCDHGTCVKSNDVNCEGNGCKKKKKKKKKHH